MPCVVFPIITKCIKSAGRVNCTGYQGTMFQFNIIDLHVGCSSDIFLYTCRMTIVECHSLPPIMLNIFLLAAATKTPACSPTSPVLTIHNIKTIFSYKSYLQLVRKILVSTINASQSKMHSCIYMFFGAQSVRETTFTWYPFKKVQVDIVGGLPLHFLRIIITEEKITHPNTLSRLISV